MKLSEMREVLSSRGIQLTKSLGQNFLHDGNQLQRIVALAELQAGDRVLEVGPGLGPLTERLLQSGASVWAIEKDARLVELLKERFRNEARLTLTQADALALLQEEPRDWSAWKLVANLPYSVASPILVELAFAPQCPERLVATLQVEVARRIAAPAGNADYGQLSLFLQARYQPVESFKIPAASFFPAPAVDSACILLKRREAPVVPHEQLTRFVRIVKRGFSARRKMMLKLLKQDWPPERLTAAYAKAGIPLDTRAEAVTLEQFAVLTGALG